ncbi:DUF11 domain-containing protein [Marinicella sediminis]|uniref:DUF11 domain-containing protein n=1 Tax=Marinicella sediminis TaxID=1792834 RepID=A0ABV7J6Y7_9GAMM|nr:DUF11 domain-containing protein [Marinicella sediminis]
MNKNKRDKTTGAIILMLSLSVAWAGSIWTLGSTPTSELFNGISSADGDFIVAVGENGTIVHFQNNDSGTVIPSGTTEELYDVYVSSNDFAVAAGEDVVLLWDGNQWSDLFTSNTNTVYTGTWISPQEDVVLYESLGQFNIICPYHPGAQDQPFCRAYQQPMITACGESNDIKLLMGSGNIEHVNNFLNDLSNNGPIHIEPVPLSLTAIWSPPQTCLPGSVEPLELFAIRNGNDFWYFDGAEWSDMNISIPGDQTLTWLSGTSRNNIIATGFKPDGMGGNTGVIWLYDGQNWTEDTNLPNGTPGLSDLLAIINPPDLIFAEGFDSAARHSRGGQIAQVDIMAAAEEGKFVSTAQLFPGSASDLRVSKRLLTPEPIRLGQRITFQIVLQNLGLDTATDFRFLDGYENNIQLVSDQCNMQEFNVYAGWRYRDTRITTMAPGDVITCTMEFDVVGPVGESLYNYAAVSELNESNYRNNRSDVKNIFIQPAQ